MRWLRIRSAPGRRAGADPRSTVRTSAWRPMPGADSPTLVFGMDWAPLMGSDPHAQARRRARAARATHHVVAAGHVGAAGWVRLPRHVRRHNLHAAALAYARLHPGGPAAGVFNLPDGRAWVVAVQAGAVLPDGDRLCADAGEAERHCATLAGRHPGLAAARLDLAELAAARAPSTRLVELGGRWRSLPLPLRVMPVLLAAAYTVQHGPQIWNRLAGGKPAVPAVDPVEAWRQALQGAASALVVHTGSDTAAVLHGLRRLPLGLRGWALRRAVCEASQDGWTCSASYLRRSRGASNAGLAQALPPGWQASFKPLDEAVLAWRVPAGGSRLDPQAVPSALFTDTDYASRLQAVRPAFIQIGLGAAMPLAVPMPRDERGVPLARPASLPELQRRPISVHGPLRSLALLARQPPPGAWRQLVLEIAPDQRAGLDSSRLIARLQGVLYEKR